MTLLSNKVIKSVTDKILSGSGYLHLSQPMFVSCNQIHSVHQSSKYWYVYAQQLSRRLSFDHVPLVPSWSHSYIYSWPVFEMSYRISKCLNILLLMTELCLQWSLKPSRHCYSLYLSVCVCVKLLVMQCCSCLFSQRHCGLHRVITSHLTRKLWRNSWWIMKTLNTFCCRFDSVSSVSWLKVKWMSNLTYRCVRGM